jgi:hypothetical protein
VRVVNFPGNKLAGAWYQESPTVGGGGGGGGGGVTNRLLHLRGRGSCRARGAIGLLQPLLEQRSRTRTTTLGNLSGSKNKDSNPLRASGASACHLWPRAAPAMPRPCMRVPRRHMHARLRRRCATCRGASGSSVVTVGSGGAASELTKPSAVGGAPAVVRRRACGGHHAMPCHAMPYLTLPYHTYHSCVRRAACGVRRAACGVRRAACGLGGAPAPPIQLTAWGVETGASQPRGGKQPQLRLLTIPKHTRPKMRSGGCTGPTIGARLGVSPLPRPERRGGARASEEVRAWEEGVARHVTSAHDTPLPRPEEGWARAWERSGARAWEEGGEGEAARGVARGAARPWLHRGTAWQQA